MNILQKIGKWLSFFPIQLMFAHLRKNQILLILWLLLFGFVSQVVGVKFGIPFLFLNPEYLNQVNILSFFILGFTIGGFFMAFHLYSYLILGPTFPFIASLSRPFYKFSINNSLLPLIFYGLLIYNIYQVQVYEELNNYFDVFLDIASLTFGIILFIFLAMSYFFTANKGGAKMFKHLKNTKSGVKSIFQKTHTYIKLTISEEQRPEYYLASPIKINHSRNVDHYDKEILDSVFKQNYFNATLFEILAIISFVFLGIFQGYDVFVIPAAGSLMLFFTLFLMFVSFLYSWFHGWTFIIVTLIILSINYLTTKTQIIEVKNYAYGLDYTSKVNYSLNELKRIQFNERMIENDIKKHISILNKWKLKAIKTQGTTKPKLIFVNVSGGGLRAAMWTFNVLQCLDELTKQKFTKSTHLITGASGGMIGAAYYRDVIRAKLKNEPISSDSILLDNVSKDLLNKVAFSLITHDLFIRHKNVSFNGRLYPKDRGFFFEQELNKNTENLMNFTLKDYQLEEKKSIIPLMVFSPTIINDGRRMIIAPQPYGFLNGPYEQNKQIGPENVEFIKLFENNSPLDVGYLTVLRTNATFPYILPMVSMPTQPEIALMDAGIRDNFGIKTTVRYIDAFKDWITENTSGVIIVQIRDIALDFEPETKPKISLIDKMIQPTLNFYGNYLQAQEFNASELIQLTKNNNFPVEVVTFVLRPNTLDRISLNWHLTQKEKNKIKKAFYNAYNQNELNKILNLFSK
jgi:hypothetical protein